MRLWGERTGSRAARGWEETGQMMINKAGLISSFSGIDPIILN